MFKKLVSLALLVLAISCTKEQSVSDANVSFEGLHPPTKVTVADNKLAWEHTDSYYL